MSYERVLASANGNVTNAGWYDPRNHESGYGLWVRVDHQNGYQTVYGHLSTVSVDRGTQIIDAAEGRVIGISGDTGDSTGSHLHFEVEPGSYSVNPYGWIGGDGNDPWKIEHPEFTNENLWLHLPSISNTDVYTYGDAIPAPPDPDPTAQGVVLVDESSGFTEDPAGCWTQATGGYSDTLRFTSTFTTTEATGYTACAGTWGLPQLAGQAGEFDVYAYIPATHATADGAIYEIRHQGRTNQAVVAQAEFLNSGSHWAYLGKYSFDLDGTEFIRLTNVTADEVNGLELAADAVMLVPLQPATPTPTPTPGPSPTPTPTHTPTPSPTPSPTPTRTPTPTPTPTPLTTTVELPILQGSDDAGQSYTCAYSTAWNEVYFGECNSGAAITSGFRFANVPVPRGATIISAYIKFTTDGPYDAPLTLRLSGEATGNAQPFSATSRPDNRPKTGASVIWSIPASDHWELGETRHTPDLSAVVQEIVNRPDWNTYNALALIVENAAPAASQHRRVIGYERPVWYPGREYGARLVLVYGGAPLPTPTPTPTSPTPTPSCDCIFTCPQSAGGLSAPKLAALAQAAVVRVQQATELADLLYRVRDEVLSQTEEGQRYIDLYYTHSAEIAALMLSDREMYDQGMATLELFVPGMEALVDGRGDTVTITAGQVQEAQAFLDTLSAAGSPALRQTIADERARRPLEPLAGMTMAQAWAYLNGYSLMWLPPLSTADPYIVQAGRTIPVQFTLTDAEGNPVVDTTVTLRLLDANGAVVVGPIGLSTNPAQGIVIQGDRKYHYDLRTTGQAPGVYTLTVSYNSANPGQAAALTILLRGR